MKNMLRTIAILVLMTAPFAGHSQVMYKELLKQDHKGEAANSVNWAGKKVYWSMKYDSTRTLKFENYSTDRIYYTMMIADNAGMSNAIKIPMMIRDLVITTFFEMYLNNGTDTKTFTLIYDKNNKWYRIKFAPQAGCRREELWKRVNDIKSFDELMNSVVGQMDHNLKLDCYRGHEAAVVME